MIKILELIDGGFIGGGQTHIISLVKNLNKNIFKAVISSSGKGEFRNVTINEGFDFCEIELPKMYRSIHLKEIRKIVEVNSIDIIHSHGGVAGMYARLFKKKHGNIKVIHTIHGIHYINSGNFMKRLVSQSIEQYLVPYTDKFICVSSSDMEIALKNKIIDRDKSVVIKNGIDLERFSIQRKDKNKELMKKYSLSEKDFLIGNISRFDFQKNQRFIISNSKELLKKYPHIKILLAGDGKYLDACKESVCQSGNADRFIFTGEVTDPENYYSLLDIFIFPSLWEGLSISLIEAMASGKCIMASKIESNKELIADDRNGYLFNTENGNEFIKKMYKLIEDKDMRDKFSGFAYSDSANYSEKAMTLSIENEYKKLII